MQPLNMWRLERVGKTLVIQPGRDARMLTAGDVCVNRQRLIDEICKTTVDAVVADLGQIERLGSELLDMLCVAWKCLPGQSRRLVLCNVSETAREVLQVARLDTVWQTYDSLEEALSAQPPVVQESGFDADTAIIDVPQLDVSPSCLRVIESGYRTVVEFADSDAIRDGAFDVRRCREEIEDLVEKHGCRDLRFDLDNISRLPSGFLGLVTSLDSRGVHVSVCHASAFVREVFESANLAHCLRPRVDNDDDNEPAKPTGK
jgi:anti-anti-sigma regulatory factor